MFLPKVKCGSTIFKINSHILNFVWELGLDPIRFVLFMLSICKFFKFSSDFFIIFVKWWLISNIYDVAIFCDYFPNYIFITMVIFPISWSSWLHTKHWGQSQWNCKVSIVPWRPEKSDKCPSFHYKVIY